MNRQTKRMMKKDEERKRTAPRPVKASVNPAKERTKPTQFVREVVGELQKVAWPSRQGPRSTADRRGGSGGIA